MDEEALKRKLAAIIEALPSGASSAEKPQAAAADGESAVAHEKSAALSDRVVEFHFNLVDGWQQQLFKALAGRYGLKHFRYEGQRETTFMLSAPERFMEETFWPQYQQLTASLRDWLEQVTERVMRDVLQAGIEHSKLRLETSSRSPDSTGPSV
jgi:hypothetical protein